MLTSLLTLAIPPHQYHSLLDNVNILNVRASLFQQLYNFKIISYAIEGINPVTGLTSNFAQVLSLVIEMTCLEAKKLPNFRDGVK